MTTSPEGISSNGLTYVKAVSPEKGQTKYPFWFGGSSASMAACVTHPLDLVKVRLQICETGVPRSMVRMFPYIISHEGLFGLYSGFTAAIMRQMTYSTVRFGVYEDLKYRYTPKPTVSNPNPRLSIIELAFLSSMAGGIGGIVGNPGDVLNVRMQSDGGKPPNLRRNYKNAIDGLIQMVHKEGLGSIFRGVGPNAGRACLMNASQLASYDVFKSLYMKHLRLSDNVVTHLAASVSAGFVATTVCSPVDVIKTRIMSDSTVPLVQMLRKIVRSEGRLWIFRGWVPSFIRLGPQTACTMLFFEQHKRFYGHLRRIDNQYNM
ncbi:MC family mitochondrial carrier protein [Bisporella sp. PMI_857]|nr:MC family mitochondrial carrier protein [Bisporella sp. PMI_857]